MSSTDAEIVAVSNLVNDHLLWVIDLIREFRFNIENVPVAIYEDNDGAIAVLTERKHTNINKRKHIDVRFKFIKECINEGRFELLPIESSNQIADFFTKSLAPIVFLKHRGNLNLMFVN